MAKKPVLSAKALSETQRLDLYERLDKWHKLTAKLAVMRDQEMELRKSIADDFFPDAEEGTNTMTLDYGKVLKFNCTITRSVDQAQLEALIAVEREREKATKAKSNVLPLLDDCIVYKPSLVVKEWKGLKEDEQKLLADIVTEKPGAPSLSIDTPKR